MTNKRTAKAIRAGSHSIVVVLPADWVRGHGIEPGNRLEILYNGVVKISVPRKSAIVKTEEAPH